MKIEVIKDYALPCMQAETALKEAHLNMLSQDYEEALHQCVEAITQVANMMTAIKYERDKA
jgi:hypothetical protein